MFGLAPAKGVLLKQMGMGQMVNTGQQTAKHPAVIDNPAHGNTAKIYPMIPTLTPDQPGPRALTPGTMISNGQFQCGFDCLRPGIGVEHMFHPIRRNLNNPVGQFKCFGMAHLERRCIIQFGRLLRNRLDDFRPPMPRVTAPKPCRSIQHLPPIGCGVIHSIGCNEHTRRLFELPIRGKRHPKRVQIIWN